MRRSYLALCLLCCVPTAGCFWRRNPPYANAPVLVHYKPTMSDSASILAERQVRRGPVKPPMPATVREDEADHAPLPKIVDPAKHEEPAPLPPSIPSVSAIAPKPGPIVRASALPSSSLPVRSADFVPVEEVAAGAPKAEPTPPPRTVPGNYGHDPDYQWLQGVLEHHHRGYICVRYCDPSVEDHFGGKFRLKEDDRLAAFHDGDVISLTGEPLGTEGQPVFTVRDVWLVRKK
jgi:hypothetical protein